MQKNITNIPIENEFFNQIESDIIWDVKTIFNYIIENYKQFLLLLFSFIIIIIVDYITHYNSFIFNSPSVIPGIVDNTTVFTNKRTKNKQLIKSKIKGKK
jgi:hypothetical protein